jgi:hypothetical protein
MGGRLFVQGTSTFQSGATFVTAPSMSGASIQSGTIPIASVVGTAADLTTSQTLGGTKTFSSQIVASSGILSVGDASINARVLVGSDVSMGGRLYVQGDSSFNGNITIRGALNVQQMQNQATEYQKLMNVEDEAVLNAQAILLTYDGIGKETLPRVTEAMIDLSLMIDVINCLFILKTDMPSQRMCLDVFCYFFQLLF